MKYEKRTTVGLPDVEAGMYGNRFSIGDLVITPFDYPDCIEDGHLLNDQIVTSVSSLDMMIVQYDMIQIYCLMFTHFLQDRNDIWVVSDERRQSMVEAVYTELKGHGRPLHYDMLAKRIVKGQYLLSTAL